MCQCTTYRAAVEHYSCVRRVSQILNTLQGLQMVADRVHGNNTRLVDLLAAQVHNSTVTSLSSHFLFRSEHSDLEV